jgi:hypothetical protein
VDLDPGNRIAESVSNGDNQGVIETGSHGRTLIVPRGETDMLGIGRSGHCSEGCLEGFRSSSPGDPGDNTLSSAGSPEHPSSGRGAVVAGARFGRIQERARDFVGGSETNHLADDGVTPLVEHLNHERIRQFGADLTVLVISLQLGDRGGTWVAGKGEVAAAALAQSRQSDQGKTASSDATQESIHDTRA